MSRDCCSKSYDIHASVANLSPRNFGEFTMRQFRDTRTNVVRMPPDSRATVLRKHANNLRLSGKKWQENKSKRHSYVVRHSHECIATVVRTKMKLKLHSWERHETLSRMSRDCRTTVARLLLDSHEIYSKITPKFSKLSYKDPFNETAT